MSKFRDYDKYEVYEDGRIFSYWTNKFLKPITLTNGYQRVWLYNNEGKRKMYLLHRVIYETFSGEPIPSEMQCNHISEDKTDCSFANINLLTPKQNCNWGTRNSRIANNTNRSKAISKAMINNKKLSKSVGAFNDNELVMTFPSANEASRNGFDHSHIVDCCNGKRKTHKGFTWKYI